MENFKEILLFWYLSLIYTDSESYLKYQMRFVQKKPEHLCFIVNNINTIVRILTLKYRGKTNNNEFNYFNFNDCCYNEIIFERIRKIHRILSFIENLQI